MFDIRTFRKRRARHAAATVTALALAWAAAAASAQPSNAWSTPPELRQLVAEALQNNPEIRAAAAERLAAEKRISPAGALEDPMFEAGVVNVPVPSWSFSAEDMTMKMLGLTQRLPFPGKRQLRSDVAAFDAEVIGHGYRETVNRVAREVRLAYYDLALAQISTDIIMRNRDVLEQFLKTAESRYAAGQATQAEVLKAQTQLARMLDELLRLERDRPSAEADLQRALGKVPPMSLQATLAPMSAVPLNREALFDQAVANRPQLLGLQAAIARADKSIELMRKDYYPDFDVKLGYGLRDRAPDGMRRDDMITFTVAINLPVWRESKLDPKVAEAIAMRDQAQQMYLAQQNELRMRLRQQIAIAEQSAKSVQLYDSAILPQARLAVEASFAAYRVNRTELLSLLDSQMTVFNYELSRAQAQASHAKALAEIDLLVGRNEVLP